MIKKTRIEFIELIEDEIEITEIPRKYDMSKIYNYSIFNQSNLNLCFDSN